MGSLERASILNELRQKLRRLESGGALPALLPLGLPAIDAALGGGLPLGCLHEVIEAPEDGAAAGFCAVLLGRLATDRPVLWCEPAGGRDGGELYAPGLPAFGLDPSRLVRLQARRESEILWAMEEGLRSGGLAAVLGELDSVPPSAGRRLQLAAETGGATGFVLRRAGRRETSGALPVTRWQISSAPTRPHPDPLPLRGRGSPETVPPLPLPLAGEGRGEGPGKRFAWRVSLLRCRLGRPQDWLVEWNHATRDLALAAAFRDGPPAPAAVGGPSPQPSPAPREREGPIASAMGG